jgi:thimet oligopeptidase
MTEARKLTAWCEERLAAAWSWRDQVLAVRGPRTLQNTLQPFDEALFQVADVEARAEAMAALHPDGAVRAAGEAGFVRAKAVRNRLCLDRGLFEAIAAVDRLGLDPLDRRFVEHTLRDFRRAGVDRDEGTRARLQELTEREAALAQEFERNIREDVRCVALRPEQLNGVPADVVQAHPPDRDGLVRLSSMGQDLRLVEGYAHSPEARMEAYRACFDRGWPANGPVLQELLGVRREKAKLLGYADWADYATEDRMSGSGARVQAFLEELAGLSEEQARRDLEALLRRKRKDAPYASGVGHWDLAYYRRLVRLEELGFDSERMRRYLDVGRVKDGLLKLVSRLFALEFRQAPDAPLWHPDVEAYELWCDGRCLGRAYLDLFPREGKEAGARLLELALGAEGRQLHEEVLVCNFPRGLLEPGQLVTFFHEFGHLLHSMLGGRQRWARFSGIRTEQDFTEVPSTLFEEWAKDPQVLRLFARHVDTGEPVPAELVERWKASDAFNRGVYVRQQIFYSALSLAYHLREPQQMDTMAVLCELQARYEPLIRAEGVHWQASFSHLADYTACYYTYLWSEVIARDLEAAIRERGLMDEATARRFRDAILAPGGSKDAAEMIRDFLGRDFGLEAFQRWLEQRPAAAGRSGGAAA